MNQYKKFPIVEINEIELSVTDISSWRKWDVRFSSNSTWLDKISSIHFYEQGTTCIVRKSWIGISSGHGSFPFQNGRLFRWDSGGDIRSVHILVSTNCLHKSFFTLIWFDLKKKEMKVDKWNRVITKHILSNFHSHSGQQLEVSLRHHYENCGMSKI